jgi:enoyl-CoA hydratase
VLAVAARVAGVPSDLAQINKRSVHRAFDVWGARAAIRAGAELQALAGHTQIAAEHRQGLLDRLKGQNRP